MYDLEITIHRGEANGLSLQVGSPITAARIIRDYLAGTWGIPLPATVNETEIARQLEQYSEYRLDHEQYRIIVKHGGVVPGPVPVDETPRAS